MMFPSGPYFNRGPTVRLLFRTNRCGLEVLEPESKRPAWYPPSTTGQHSEEEFIHNVLGTGQEFVPLKRNTALNVYHKSVGVLTIETGTLGQHASIGKVFFNQGDDENNNGFVHDISLSALSLQGFC
jgi:hypothetical protein